MLVIILMVIVVYSIIGKSFHGKYGMIVLMAEQLW